MHNVTFLKWPLVVMYEYLINILLNVWKHNKNIELKSVMHAFDVQHFQKVLTVPRMLDLVIHELGTVTCATRTCSVGGSIDIEFYVCRCRNKSLYMKLKYKSHL